MDRGNLLHLELKVNSGEKLASMIIEAVFWQSLKLSTRNNKLNSFSGILSDSQKSVINQYIQSLLNENTVFGTPKYFTLEDVSKILQMRLKTIRAKAYEGKIPGQKKIFGRYRVDPIKFRKAFL